MKYKVCLFFRTIAELRLNSLKKPASQNAAGAYRYF